MKTLQPTGKKVTPSQIIDLAGAHGKMVISRSQSLVISVPSLKDGGEPLLYPAGTKDNTGKNISNTPILNRHGNPVGKMGLRWSDSNDRYHAVTGDGLGAIIVKRITADNAQQGIDEMRHGLSNPGPVSAQEFRNLLFKAAQRAAHPLHIVASSKQEVIQTMVPVSSHASHPFDNRNWRDGDINAGWVRPRNLSEIASSAFIVSGGFTFRDRTFGPDEDALFLVDRASQEAHVTLAWKLEEGHYLHSDTLIPAGKNTLNKIEI